MSGLLRQSLLRHVSTCSCYWGFPTLGHRSFSHPRPTSHSVHPRGDSLHFVRRRLPTLYNGKNSSHGMIVVWLLQSDTNLQLFYGSKKSFLKYFHFQPPNLRFSTPKLTFRGWERPPKRNNKCSLR